MGGSWQSQRVGRRPSAGRVWLALALALVTPTFACGGGGGRRPGGDADVDAGGDGAASPEPAVEEPALPVAPMPPALPVLTPCPPGWREVTDPERGTTCEPWPERGPADCDDDEAHLPGEPDCVRIGSACPAGEWADDLPADATVLYVRAGAPDGGDGSRGAPFGTIAAAMAAARDGTVVALGKGTFDEAVALRAGVTLWGACVADTTITTTGASAIRPAAILPAGEGSVVRNLRLTGDRFGVWARGRASVELQDVAIVGCAGYGVLAEGGAAVGARGIAIRGTRSVDGRYGQGVRASGGSTVTLERAVIERNLGSGVQLFDPGTSAVLQDVAVRGTAPQPGDSTSFGMLVADGATASAVRIALDDNAGDAIVADGEEAAVELEDTWIGRPAGSSDGTYGASAYDGAHLQARRAQIEGHWAGAVAHGAGSEVTLEDVVLVGPAGCEAPDETGAVAQEGATLRAVRLSVAGVCGFGVKVASGSSAVVADLTLREGDLSVTGGSLQVSRGEVLRPTMDGVFASAATLTLEDLRVLEPQSGWGVIAGDGTILELRRAVLAFGGTGLGAVVLLDEGGSATLDDVTVEDTGARGWGVWAQGRTSVDAHRLLVRGTGLVAVAASAGAELTATDLTVLDTLAVREAAGGRGVYVEEGARVEVTRARLEGAHDLGVSAFGAGTETWLTDLRVTGTRAFSDLCAADLCGGVGAGSFGGASVEITRFLISDNEVAGLQIAGGGTMDLHDGLVEGHPIGASIDTDGFDPGRLSDGVVFRDNARTFDSMTLPVPEPTPPPPPPPSPF